MLEHGLCRPSTNESRYVVARHLVHRRPRRRRLCDREVGRSMPWNTPLLLPTHVRTHACSYPYPSPSKRPLLRIHRTHLGHRDPKQPACQSAPPADEAAELHALQLQLAQRGELMLIGHKLGSTHRADGPRCRSRRRELSFVSITTSLQGVQNMFEEHFHICEEFRREERSRALASRRHGGTLRLHVHDEPESSRLGMGRPWRVSDLPLPARPLERLRGMPQPFPDSL